MEQHLDENAILAMLDHRMSRDERAAAEVHLDACPSCLELLALMAASSPPISSPSLAGADTSGARGSNGAPRQVEPRAERDSSLPTDPTERDVSKRLGARRLDGLRLGPGDMLANRFVLEHVVGEGGMAVVWAARDAQAAQRLVALKIMKEVSGAERARFVREGRLMRTFGHPGILDVREVLALGEDVVLVMDLLEGESLGAHLARVGRLPAEEAIRFLAPLVDAAAFAHARGVVHRDLKPENVFLCADGRVLLLDFGMAKLTAAFDSTISGWMTESGLILGTPHYMAPEQIYGERDVDARADVWALGVIAYECLSGERPISGKSFGQVVRALTTRAIVDIDVRAPAVPRPLASIVHRMLSHDRAARPSLDEVRAVLTGPGARASV